MQNSLLAAGCVLVLLAASMPGAAHHIQEDSVNDQNGLDPQEWGGSVRVSFPVGDPLTDGGDLCNLIRNLYGLDPLLDQVIDSLCIDDPAWDAGDGIVALTLCEDQPEPPLPGRSGIGGLCYMAPGFEGAPCAFVGSGVNQGNSNGKWPTYDGSACATQLAAIPLQRQWYRITMQVEEPTAYDVPFLADIGGRDCGRAAREVVFDGIYTDAVGGHVGGYPAAAPPLGTYGSYTVESYVGDPARDAGLVACAGAFPMYITAL